jgi:hypothetical protein
VTDSPLTRRVLAATRPLARPAAGELKRAPRHAALPFRERLLADALAAPALAAGLGAVGSIGRRS